MTSSTGFQLDHLNLPARDPEGLARWYAQTFGMQADAHRVRAPGVLISFQRGEPLGRAPEIHAGFRVASLATVKEWAGRFGATLKAGEEFTSFQTHDPEGNCIEIYCRSEPGSRG